jgi:hypothetical protein
MPKSVTRKSKQSILQQDKVSGAAPPSCLEVFYSAFPAVHYPHFRADTKKKVRGGLAKLGRGRLTGLLGRHWASER